MKKALALLVITAALALAQVPKPGGGGGPGGSGATSLDGLSDVTVGTTPPGTCTDDSLYLDTSEAIPAERLKICESNTWYKVAELTAGDYIDITGRTISLSTSVPIFSSGASDPSGACETREIYLQTTTKDWWGCEGTSTWRRLTGSVYALVDTGGDDTYGNSTACAGFPATYVDGQVVILQATTANTGAATLDCRPGAKAIKLPDGTTDPTTGDVVAFKPTILQYKSSADGGSGAWILLVPGSGSGSGSMSTLSAGVFVSGMAQSATRYHTLGSESVDATQGLRQVPLNRNGTLRNLYVSLLGAVGGSGQTITITLQVAGSDTSITCQIATGATTCNDTSNSAAVTAGQLFSVKYVTTGTTGTLYPTFSVSFE